MRRWQSWRSRKATRRSKMMPLEQQKTQKAMAGWIMPSESVCRRNTLSKSVVWNNTKLMEFAKLNSFKFLIDCFCFHFSFIFYLSNFKGFSLIFALFFVVFCFYSIVTLWIDFLFSKKNCFIKHIYSMCVSFFKPKKQKNYWRKNKQKLSQNLGNIWTLLSPPFPKSPPNFWDCIFEWIW